MTEIIVAVLALIGSLAGTYVSNKKSSELIVYRIEQLEKQVNKHNGLIERTYRLEESDAVTNEKIAAINNRIRDLERYHM
jgi:hypothetical protein